MLPPVIREISDIVTESTSPSCTVDLNVTTFVPLPLSYNAVFLLEPTDNVIHGKPGVSVNAPIP